MMCLTLCSSPDSSTFSHCTQICPEWSWWGTRTPSWDPAGCPPWDRRSGASWPSPTNPCSPSIWRRRWSLWQTTAWLWTSGTLWFTWFSNGNVSVGLAQPWRFPSWHVTVKLVIMTPSTAMLHHGSLCCTLFSYEGCRFWWIFHWNCVVSSFFFNV